NWPPPVATSDVTFCRSVFSGSVTYFTLIPYFFVKTDVSDCMTTMSGLFTVAIVSVGCPWCAPDRALLTPTSTTRLETTAPASLTASRENRIVTPFIGFMPPSIERAVEKCGNDNAASAIYNSGDPSCQRQQREQKQRTFADVCGIYRMP